MVAFDARVVVLSLRIAQAVLAVIVLAVTAYGTITNLIRSRSLLLTVML